MNLPTGTYDGSGSIIPCPNCGADIPDTEVVKELLINGDMVGWCPYCEYRVIG